MSKPKSKKNEQDTNVESTPEGKVFNFTRHGFVVKAETLSEARKALKEYLNESKVKKESEEVDQPEDVNESKEIEE